MSSLARYGKHFSSGISDVAITSVHSEKTSLKKNIMIYHWFYLYCVDENEVLAGSLADGALADAFVVPPHPPIPPANIRKVRGRQKSTDSNNTKKIY